MIFKINVKSDYKMSNECKENNNTRTTGHMYTSVLCIKVTCVVEMHCGSYYLASKIAIKWLPMY